MKFFPVSRWTAVTVLALASLASAQEGSDTRQEMEIFARALDGSVRQVQRASLGGLLGAESSRGYHLKGHGAFFVLPPRLLPPPGRDRFLVMPGFQVSGEWSVELGEEELPPPGEAGSAGVRDLSGREGRKKKVGSRPRSPVPEDDLRVLEEQARVLQQEAARSRQEAERMMEDFIREVRQGRTDPVTPASTPLPPPPTPPEPPVAPTAPLPPSPPPPPWSIWFPSEGGRAAVSADKILEDVRTAVTAVLERQRAPRAVRPDEFVTVAIDFLPGGFWVGGGLRPVKTVVIRVRRKEMDERQAGKLEADEFRKRVEYQEY
jgi:hypothetical protein